MMSIASGFEVWGVYCFPSPTEESRVFYLPLAADCQRDPSGRPQAHLLAAGETAFLQLATIWDIPGSKVEQVRREVAARRGIADPALLQLAFSPVNVEVIELIISENAKDERVLATSRGSGLPPYSAMFNMPLSGVDRDRAMAAFSRREGFLRIRYRASLTAPVVHQARLTGDLSGISDVSGLETALAEGRATLAMALVDAGLREAFVARGSELLNLFPPAMQGVAELLIELVLEERAEITATTDVGTWFEGVAPGVTPVLGPGFGPSPEPALEVDLPVTLDLPGAAEVVEVVEVATVDAKARLDPPNFPSVSIPRPEAAAPVHVRTTFVGGGDDFEADLEAPATGPLALAPGDLGLTEVTVDGGPLAERGLDKLRTTLRYRPDGPGERNERTFHFRQPPFGAHWLVVSRGEPLGSSLTYEYRATLRSGESVAHGPVAALSPTITLTANPEE